jgi:peptidoglycan hydrolase-like protein with peptidoglycan-binding domain
LDEGIDGDFGPTTETAVKALQKRYGLEPDGVVGGSTWEILLRR